MEITPNIREGMDLTEKLTVSGNKKYTSLLKQWDALKRKWEGTREDDRPPLARLFLCQVELLDTIFYKENISRYPFNKFDRDELNNVITILNNSFDKWYDKNEGVGDIVPMLPREIQDKLAGVSYKKYSIFDVPKSTGAGRGNLRERIGIGGTLIDYPELEAFVERAAAPAEERHTTKAKPPAHEMSGAEPPAALPAKGNILYDIPDSMLINKQHKCVVRIAKDEATAKDDDTFTNAVKIEDIPLAGTMKVELIDIAEPPHFTIKSISSAEQEVDTESYTEWLFWVTPLMSGTYDLILKTSVLKTVDGKERRKDIVFEKSIHINADTDTAMSFAGTLAPSGKDFASANLKSLSGEKNVTVMEPPAVFISYAHKDKIYFDIFSDNLRSQSGWNIWTDRNIETGSDWFTRIQDSIKQSDFAVLLVSADFISSGFIKQNEFAEFLKLEKSKQNFAFLPVLLRDVDFTRWQELAAMQFFTAYGDEYGIPEMKGKMIPFARLCRFDNNSQLIPNDNIDTYFKNFVLKVTKEWLAGKRAKVA